MQIQLPDFPPSTAVKNTSVLMNTFDQTSWTSGIVSGQQRAATVYTLHPATALTSLTVYARLSTTSFVHCYNKNDCMDIQNLYAYIHLNTLVKEIIAILAPLKAAKLLVIV